MHGCEDSRTGPGFAYGFDRARFKIPAPLDRKEYRIEWIPFREDDLSALRDATGIIVPSGIFEEIRRSSDYMGVQIRVFTNSETLLAFERQGSKHR